MKVCVSEIRVKRIRVNQGLGVQTCDLQNGFIPIIGSHAAALIFCRALGHISGHFTVATFA